MTRVANMTETRRLPPLAAPSVGYNYEHHHQCQQPSFQPDDRGTYPSITQVQRQTSSVLLTSRSRITNTPRAEIDLNNYGNAYKNNTTHPLHRHPPSAPLHSIDTSSQYLTSPVSYKPPCHTHRRSIPSGSSSLLSLVFDASASRTLPPLPALRRYHPLPSAQSPFSTQGTPVQSSHTCHPPYGRPDQPLPPASRSHPLSTPGPSFQLWRPPPPIDQPVYYRRPFQSPPQPTSPPQPPSPTAYRVGPKTVDPLRPEGLYKASKGAQRDLKWHKKQRPVETSPRRPPEPVPNPSFRQPPPPHPPLHHHRPQPPRLYTTRLHQPRPIRYLPYTPLNHVRSRFEMAPRKTVAKKAPAVPALSEHDLQRQIEQDLILKVYNLTRFTSCLWYGCTAELMSWAHLEKHIRSSHLPAQLDADNGPERVVCWWKTTNKQESVCGQSFASATECLNHCTGNGSQHMAAVASRCPFSGCTRFFKSFKELKAHVVKSHPESGSATSTALAVNRVVPSRPAFTTSPPLRVQTKAPSRGKIESLELEMPVRKRQEALTSLHEWSMRLPLDPAIVVDVEKLKPHSDTTERLVSYKFPQDGDFEYGSDYFTPRHIASSRIVYVIIGSAKRRRETLVAMDREAARTGTWHGYTAAVVPVKTVHRWVANLRVDPDLSAELHSPESCCLNLTSFLSFLNKNDPPYPIVDTGLTRPSEGKYLAPDYGDANKLVYTYSRFVSQAKAKIQHEKLLLDGPRPSRKSRAILEIEVNAPLTPLKGSGQPARRLSFPAGERVVSATTEATEAARRMSVPSLGKTSGAVRKITLIYKGAGASTQNADNIETTRPSSGPVVTNHRAQRPRTRSRPGLEVSIDTAPAPSIRTAPVGGSFMRRGESSQSLASMASSLDVTLVTPPMESCATFESVVGPDGVKVEVMTGDVEMAVEGETSRKRKAPTNPQSKKRRKS